MAGEAPELLPEEGRLRRWLGDLSDARLSAYMLLAAALVGVLLLAADLLLFG